MPPSGGTVPGKNGGRRGAGLVPGRPQRILDHLGREDAALRAYDPAGGGCARDGL